MNVLNREAHVIGTDAIDGGRFSTTTQKPGGNMEHAAKTTIIMRQELYSLMLAGCPPVRRRLCVVDECRRVGDQRERQPAPILVHNTLGTGHSNHVCIALHSPPNILDRSISLHASSRDISRVALPTCDKHAVHMACKLGTMWSSSRVALLSDGATEEHLESEWYDPACR